MWEFPEPISVPEVDPRRRRARRIIAGVVTIALVAILGVYASLALLAPLAPAALAAVEPTVEVPGPVEFRVPYTGSSAVSVSGAADFPATEGVDGILVSGGDQGPRPIASITKLVSAMVILNAHPLAAGEDGPTLTFSEADADLYDEYYVIGATIQPMKAGSRMTLHDALEMMLVVSATNYADAVSGWAFGSQRNFRAATQEWLAANGLANTTIVEPTGVDPGNTSTPADLIALGRIARASPVVAEITGYTQLAVPAFDPVPNTNTLLGEHGVGGLKTGTLEEAGACLLYSAQLDVVGGSSISIVGVVLGGGTRGSVNEEVVTLLDSIVDGFHSVRVVTAEQQFGTYTTPWGDEATVVAAEGASLPTWSDTPVTATVDLQEVTTASDGSTVGTATFVAGTQTVTVPLVLDGAIGEPDAWWRLTHPAELF